MMWGCVGFRVWESGESTGKSDGDWDCVGVCV